MDTIPLAIASAIGAAGVGAIGWLAALALMERKARLAGQQAHLADLKKAGELRAADLKDTLHVVAPTAVAIAASGEKVAALNQRVDAIEDRVDATDERHDRLEERVARIEDRTPLPRRRSDR